VTLKSAELDAPRRVAVTVEVVGAVTGVVVIAKDTELAPWGTATLAGTPTTAGLELESVIVPAVCAGPFSVTVAVEPDPPTAEPGENVTERGSGVAVTRIVSVALTPPYAAVIDAFVGAETAVRFSGNVSEVWLTGTVTVAGGKAKTELGFESVTTAPPAGARAVNFTVAVAATRQ
jgi:hypothetical protein